jgi:hypothetical protein
MNKHLAPLAVALLTTSLASAMDLTLANGQVLRDVHVVRQDAATVTFRHAAGFAQIEKRKLPPALLEQYPLDEAQAKLEADRQQQEAAARQAEAKRISLERLQAAATSNAAAPEPIEETPEQPAVAPTPAFDSEQWRDTYARNQFRYERQQRWHRDYEYNHDYSHQPRHREYPRAPAPAPAPASRMTPAVHMTPDIHMTPDPQDVTSVLPPEETADTQDPRRSRHERSN